MCKNFCKKNNSLEIVKIKEQKLLQNLLKEKEKEIIKLKDQVNQKDIKINKLE